MPRGRRKICSQCQERLTRDQVEWALDDGGVICSACYLNLAGEYPGASRAYIHRAYGLDLEEHGEMFLRQLGVCGICRTRDTLVIDHDHETGKVRGLLCQPCNKGLGFFRDDITRLARAIVYLN